jgi:hypothetical protein
MRTCVSVFLTFLLFPLLSRAQDGQSPKVCVAVVSNASTVSADLDRLSERLVKTLTTKEKRDAVAMDSNTTMNTRLRPTRQNSDEADDKQCEYTVLTQIVENRAHPALAPTRRPGGPIVPDLDASATQPGPGSASPYREEMQINFAVFRRRRTDPVVDTAIFQQSSAGVSDTFLSAMDRVASRVSHEIKSDTKKK